MTLKAQDYMAKPTEIERINALDIYFTKRPKTDLSTEIDFHLIKANKITQIAIWPETVAEFQKYVNRRKIIGNFLRPGAVCQIESANFVRIEPIKWWLLDDEDEVFQSLSEEIGLTLDLSHSFVRLKILGKYARSVL